ncbi:MULTISPECIES: hypothetical protein [unclassified Saccharothrix]|uniref:hypothetical protein n=1 Tax=unclassified Saccharothrix TaxID=2593673 RepID=UPI00307E3FE6
MKARLAAAVAALLLFPGVATAAESTPSMEVSAATLTFCLTPTAEGKLAEEGIVLDALEPAVDADADGRRCVRMPVTGRMTPDLDKVDLLAEGGLRFRSADRELRFHTIRAQTETGRIVVRALPNDEDDEVELFAVDVARVSTTPTVEPVGLELATPLATTADVAAEFAQAFDRVLFAEGDELVDATGEVELISASHVVEGTLD